MTASFHPDAADAEGALALVQPPRSLRRIATLCALALPLCGLLLLLPWQQSARGTGRVIAFAPQER